MILSSNLISKIDSLDNLTNLKFLDLSKNKLRNLDKYQINNLPSLKGLILDFNYLKNIMFISYIISLAYLSVQSNKITEFNSLNPISNLVNLTDIFLIGNKIEKSINYRTGVLRRNHNIKRIDNKDLSLEEKDFIEYEKREILINSSEVNNKFSTNLNNSIICNIDKSNIKVNFIDIKIDTNNFVKCLNKNNNTSNKKIQIGKGKHYFIIIRFS